MRTIRMFLSTALLLISSLAFAGPVDINSADAQTLASNIKGIGVKKATAIVEYREKNGPFKSVEELANVKGIGSKLVDINRDTLLIDSTEK